MITKEDIQPGDILLYRINEHSNPFSWFIAWAQNVIGKNPAHKDAYSHVSMIDHDTDYLLEATIPKSRRVKIDWNRLNKKYTIQVWRVKNVTQQQIDTAIQWCNNHLNDWYDFGLLFWGLFDIGHAEVCSTFVYKAWKSAGIIFKVSKVIAGNTQFLTPDEISAQEVIERIK